MVCILFISVVCNNCFKYPYLTLTQISHPLLSISQNPLGTLLTLEEALVIGMKTLPNLTPKKWQ